MLCTHLHDIKSITQSCLDYYVSSVFLTLFNVTPLYFLGLLMEIFNSLWENSIISKEAFIKWKTCKDTQYESEGKGVAVASLSPFFVSLSEQDDTDDDSS